MWRHVTALSRTRGELEEKALQKNDWTWRETDGLKLLQSPLLAQEKPLIHAFTTRLGGKSSQPLEWFNLGRHWDSDESRQDAMTNRSRLCKALQINFSRLVVPGQVHSTRVEWVSEPESLPDVDGVATVTPDTPLLLHYADCVPVIIFERTLPAVLVVHAGWRGTAGGIVRKGVEVLRKVMDAKPQDIIAAVGPAIGDCCYPVGDDVAQKLKSSVGNADALVRLADEKPHPDLKAINAMQLLEAGVSAVDVSSYCTNCHPELFYSHRYGQGKTGRQGAIASLREI